MIIILQKNLQTVEICSILLVGVVLFTALKNNILHTTVLKEAGALTATDLAVAQKAVKQVLQSVHEVASRGPSWKDEKPRGEKKKCQ